MGHEDVLLCCSDCFAAWKESFCFPSLARLRVMEPVYSVLHISSSFYFRRLKRQLGQVMLRLEATTRLEMFDDAKVAQLSFVYVGGDERALPGTSRTSWRWVGVTEHLEECYCFTHHLQPVTYSRISCIILRINLSSHLVLPMTQLLPVKDVMHLSRT